jgi:hypothetical protein
LSTLLAERDVQAQAFIDADKRLDECELRQTQISIEMNYTRDWIHHRAIQTRNARVMKRLRADFATRQGRLGHGKDSEKPQADTEYVLPILPVSTRAFWQLESNETPMAGFPNQTYTGIPAAEQWLHRATLAKREKHLDETLDGYQNLMTMMRIYSATNGQDGDFNFTRTEVEGALADTHAFYTEVSFFITLEDSLEDSSNQEPLETGIQTGRDMQRDLQTRPPRAQAPCQGEVHA